MKHFIKYLVVWISQNLSIPFWMVGHVHLSVNVYEDLYEILASVGMNLIVATGFFIDYIDQRNRTLNQNKMNEEVKVFTLKEYLQAVDNAYSTGKANASVKEKEEMIDHIKYSAKKWTDIVTKSE